MLRHNIKKKKKESTPVRTKPVRRLRPNHVKYKKVYNNSEWRSIEIIKAVPGEYTPCTDPGSKLELISSLFSNRATTSPPPDIAAPSHQSLDSSCRRINSWSDVQVEDWFA